MSRTGEVADALKARGIKVMPASQVRAYEDGASVSFPLADAQWFADDILATPVPPDDGLASRFFGRTQDMTVGDDAWLFEIHPSIPGRGRLGQHSGSRRTSRRWMWTRS